MCTLYHPITLTKVVFHVSQLTVLLYNCPLTSWEYRLQFKPQGGMKLREKHEEKKKKEVKTKQNEPKVENIGKLSPLSFKDMI